MESSIGPTRSLAANVEAVRKAFDDAGVAFIAADEAGGHGVRHKSK
jgi:hypothetical protein